MSSRIIEFKTGVNEIIEIPPILIDHCEVLQILRYRGSHQIDVQMLFSKLECQKIVSCKEQMKFNLNEIFIFKKYV